MQLLAIQVDPTHNNPIVNRIKDRYIINFDDVCKVVFNVTVINNTVSFFEIQDSNVFYRTFQIENQDKIRISKITDTENK